MSVCKDFDTFFNELLWSMNDNKDTTPLMEANKKNLLRFVQEQKEWNNKNGEHDNIEKFVLACGIVDTYCNSQA